MHTIKDKAQFVLYLPSQPVVVIEQIAIRYPLSAHHPSQSTIAIIAIIIDIIIDIANIAHLAIIAIILLMIISGLLPPSRQSANPTSSPSPSTCSPHHLHHHGPQIVFLLLSLCRHGPYRYHSSTQ
jgi:hypothetical protein